MQLVDMAEKKVSSGDMRSIAVRVDAELYRRVKTKMAQHDETFQSLVVQLLEGYASDKGTSTASQSELQPNLHASKQPAVVTPISPGVMLSKPLESLVPMLEHLLATASTRSTLRLVIESLYAKSGAEEVPVARTANSNHPTPPPGPHPGKPNRRPGRKRD